MTGKSVREQVIDFLADYGSSYVEDMLRNGVRGYKDYSNSELLAELKDNMGVPEYCTIDEIDEDVAHLIRELDAQIVIDSKIQEEES